ncbi:glycoside hydrolase family 108 protein [Phytohalomonas tamaricis]|uniref:glycoside hydrolase family 108 protein n=1 Tax=Phytohalomonas tamaricis TaxID=2081032 RepID=UPI0021D4610A|nr:glycosyl hydrolase 108 family protein [Phytohalomonas tamaricis]
MIDFDTAFERLIGHEGDLTMNPDDPGNWTGGSKGNGELRGTKYGVSAAAYPALNISALTLDDAKEVYRRDYWNRARCDDLDGAVAFQVFDAAVNHGIGNAIRFLQRAVKVADDGIVGPVTLRAVNSYEASTVAFKFNSERLKFYTKLSSFNVFGRGWANRVAGNLEYAAEDS